MTHLVAEWRLADRVVEQRVLPVREGMVVGDDVLSPVCHPGPPACLERRDGRWWLGEQCLSTSHPVTLGTSRWSVRIRLMDSRPERGGSPGLPDLRVLTMMLALLLGLGSAEVAFRTLYAHPEATRTLQAWAMGRLSDLDPSPLVTTERPRGEEPDLWRPVVSLRETAD